MYELCCSTCEDVLEHMASHVDFPCRLFPTFGFGGQALAPGSITSHCFPLNGDPYGICAGVPGILAAYRQALAQWRLAGPTLFAPIIRMAISFASQHLGASPPKYTCLLILTDGEIMDMDVSDAGIQCCMFYTCLYCSLRRCMTFDHSLASGIFEKREASVQHGF